MNENTNAFPLDSGFDLLSHIFATGPNTVTPTQYYVTSLMDLDAERRLFLAVLEDALRLWQRHAKGDSVRSKYACEEVRSWLFIENHGGITFEMVCDAMQWDIDVLRQRLHKIVEARAPLGVLGSRRVGGRRVVQENHQRKSA